MQEIESIKIHTRVKRSLLWYTPTFSKNERKWKTENLNEILKFNTNQVPNFFQQMKRFNCKLINLLTHTHTYINKQLNGLTDTLLAYKRATFFCYHNKENYVKMGLTALTHFFFKAVTKPRWFFHFWNVFGK